MIKMSKPYFSHDIDARGDIKIKALIYRFGWEGYGLYWAIVEFLHANEFSVEDVEIVANDLKVECALLEKILKDTKLFQIIDGKFVSERVIRNLKQQEEKSKKAKKSAASRWQRRAPEQPRQPETPPADNTDEEEDLTFAYNVVSEFNSLFKKANIVGKETLSNIKKVSEKEHITLEQWSAIFKNARKGWQYPDGKNVKPSLKTIIADWDSFLSDDYYLAEDKEEKVRLAKEKEEQAYKEKMQLEREKQAEIKKQKDMQAAICDKKTAMDYIKTYYSPCQINNSNLRLTSSYVREMSEKYGFTLDEMKAYMEGGNE